MATLAEMFLCVPPVRREDKGSAERLTPCHDATTTGTRIPTLAIDANERTILGLVPTTLTFVLAVVSMRMFGIIGTRTLFTFGDCCCPHNVRRLCETHCVSAH